MRESEPPFSQSPFRVASSEEIPGKVRAENNRFGLRWMGVKRDYLWLDVGVECPTRGSMGRVDRKVYWAEVRLWVPILLSRRKSVLDG
jgi:hypothetical protein